MDQVNYKFFDNYVLRVPTFSISKLDESLSMKYSPDDNWETRFSNPIFQEAIFLASPLLYSEMKKCFDNKSNRFEDHEKLFNSLLKYYVRMSTRCTPFGAFAGFSLGKISSDSEIVLDSLDVYEPYTRLDMDYLCELALDLSKNKTIRKTIKFYLNSSLYYVNSQFRFVQYKYLKNRRKHFIVGIEDSIYLRIVFREASKGATIGTLTRVLTGEGIEASEAETFIDELINNQILTSALEPSTSGIELLDHITNIISSIKGIDIEKQAILKLRSHIENLNKRKLGVNYSVYSSIINTVELINPNYEINHLFQMDLVVSAKSNHLNSEIIKNVYNGLRVLNKLKKRRSNKLLEQFKRSFYNKYEERTMPLSWVLDNEIGIGLNNGNTWAEDIAPLVDDILLPPSPHQDRDIPWDKTDSYLLKLLTQGKKSFSSVVELLDEDLNEFQEDWSDIPDTFSVLLEIIDDTTIHLKSSGGASATSLLGRFGFANDEMLSYIKNIADIEKEINQKSILAEIIHLPESRTGNVILRPLLRDYEIPYLASSTLPKSHQIDINDLTVSIQGDKILLFSKSLQKEVIPMLSNAHNYSNNALPIYKFLSMLQAQNKCEQLSFAWGTIFNEHSFLPRVCYKNIILSAATWKINRKEIEPIFEINDIKKLSEAIQNWRNKKGLPAKVLLIEGDNEFYINFKMLTSIKIFISLVKKRNNFILTEFLFDNKTCLVTNGQDNFTNQIIVGFYKETNS